MRASPWLSVLVGLCLPLGAGANSDSSRALHFDEVLQSVTAHDPRIRRAVEGLRKAEGKSTEARGAFDPALEGSVGLKTGAYYDLREADAELRQATSLWGSEVYLGYRIGRGLNERWPTYLDNQTLSGGEVRAGVEVPIWRGGLIDEERAQRSKAERLEEAARQGVSSTALSLELAAARAYWGWVSAGRTLEVTRSLLALAEQRDQQLRRRLSAGSIAEFDVQDNERILYERRALLVSAERAFERAQFDLSLFLRDSEGRSTLVDRSRLPELPAPSEEPLSVEDALISRVLSCHPELRRARAELRASEVDVRLSRNQVAPELGGRFEYSRDLGELTGTEQDLTLPGNVFAAGIELSMPLLLRKERGRASAARAEVAQKEADIDFLEDRYEASVRDAASAVRAASERVELTQSVLVTAAALARGERSRFEVGASNLVFVNLREQQAAMAEIQFIEATALAQIERTRWDTTTRVACGSGD